MFSALGPGHEESVYQEALAVEFKKRLLKYEIERNLEVVYKGVKVGVHRLDFIVEGSVLVELKSTQQLTEAHEWQTRAYMTNARLRFGMLINFPRFELSGVMVKTFETEFQERPMVMGPGKW